MRILTIFALSSILSICINFTQAQNQAPTQQSLSIVYYNYCEGADAANYTMVAPGTMSSDCSRLISDQGIHLIQTNSTNQQSVISLQQLAAAAYQDGAFSRIENLWLATSGPLQARYIYEQAIYLSAAYLKKCSSVLGYSFVSSRSAVLLISQNLDLNIFLAPNGAFEAFKRGSTTTCRGRVYIF